jgi:hypothetical protein
VDVALERGPTASHSAGGLPSLRPRQVLDFNYESIILIDMSKRLQVLLDEDDLRLIQRVARGKGTTVSEWVRQAILAAAREEPLSGREKKLASVRAAVEHSFPTAGIEQMLDEIERGRAREDLE